EAATPGPWETDGEWVDTRPDGPLDMRTSIVAPGVTEEETEANAEFIAAARSAVPALLQEREEMIAALHHAHQAITQLWNTLVSESPPDHPRRLMNGQHAKLTAPIRAALRRGEIEELVAALEATNHDGG